MWKFQNFTPMYSNKKNLWNQLVTLCQKIYISQRRNCHNSRKIWVIEKLSKVHTVLMITIKVALFWPWKEPPHIPHTAKPSAIFNTYWGIFPILLKICKKMADFSWCSVLKLSQKCKFNDDEDDTRILRNLQQKNYTVSQI